MHFIQRRARHVGLMSALIFGLFLCLPATAQEVTARTLWYGVYTLEKQEPVDDPTSPTGKRLVVTPVPPTVNTINIPGRTLQFGVEYVLSGRSGTVTVRKVYRFPSPGFPDGTGGLRSSYEQTVQQRIGDAQLMGWSFHISKPAEIVPGEWIFEVWQGNRKILEQRFVVGAP